MTGDDCVKKNISKTMIILLTIDLLGSEMESMNPLITEPKDDGSSLNDDRIRHGYYLISQPIPEFSDSTKFEHRIEELMDDGWQLVGAPFIANERFYQALTIIKQ